MAETKPTAAAASNQTANTPADDEPKNEPVSKLDPIPCIAKKQFYSREGALVEIGQGYNWTYTETEQVFPWPILEPQDESLHKALKQEYTDFFAKNQERFGVTAERNRILARLAEIGVD